MKRPPPTHERLEPGAHCRLTEQQWAETLERSEPLHQWGSAFLVDDGEHVRAYLRDVSGEGRHTAWCFDAARSARARAGVREVEALEEALAKLISAEMERGGADPAQQAASEAARAAYVEAAETLYAELLVIARGAGG